MIDGSTLSVVVDTTVFAKHGHNNLNCTSSNSEMLRKGRDVQTKHVAPQFDYFILFYAFKKKANRLTVLHYKYFISVTKAYRSLPSANIVIIRDYKKN